MVMSRARAVPPDLFTDERLIALPMAVKLTAVGLRLQADDQGRETATTWQLKSNIWPGTAEVTEDALVEHLLLLEDVGYIQLYSDSTRTYYQVLDWPVPSHPARSKYPDPPRRNRDGMPTESFPAGERERAGESEAWERPPGVPPSPFCRVHQPAGSNGVPCVRCRDARFVYDQWIREQQAGGGDGE